MWSSHSGGEVAGRHRPWDLPRWATRLFAHRPLPILSSDRATYQPLLFGKSCIWAWVSLEIEPWEVLEHTKGGEEGT